MVILLMVINSYTISGYWWFSIIGHWWLFYVMTISDYYIINYCWIFQDILSQASIGYYKLLYLG